MRAQVFEIVDLVGERVGLAFCRRRTTSATLVVENYAAFPGEDVPGRRNMFVGVVEARASVYDNERSGVSRAEHLVVDGGATCLKCGAVFVSGESGKGDKEYQEEL